MTFKRPLMRSNWFRKEIIEHTFLIVEKN